MEIYMEMLMERNLDYLCRTVANKVLRINYALLYCNVYIPIYIHLYMYISYRTYTVGL